MNIFKSFGNELNYNDSLQLDGAFSVAHINYYKSPMFNGVDSKDMAINSRKSNLSSEEKIEDVLGCLYSFNGTEKNFKKDDRNVLWKNYWLEYINIFDKLINLSPSSVVTIFVGRQAIEIGFKYLLLKKNEKIIKTHDLGKLSNLLSSEYNFDESYMDDVDTFCKTFCKYIEGGNVEYFRFPEYKVNTYFASNHLEISWLSYNFALILLKLIHLANLEAEM